MSINVSRFIGVVKELPKEAMPNDICILDGDNDTQVDLNIYAGENNGLRRVSEVFRGQNFYG